MVAGVLIALSVIIACDGRTEPTWGSGTIEAVTVTVSARSGGQITAVTVREGESISAGDIVAQIDTTAMEFELEQAERTVDLYDARLALILAGARDEDVRQAEAARDQAQQNLALAERSFQRVSSLFESGSATSSDLDAARTQYEVARAGAAAAEAALEKVAALARPEEIRAARAQLDAARVAVELVRNRIDEATVRSPISGTVLTRIHEAGEIVSPGTPLYRIADLRAMVLTVVVPGPSLAAVTLGMDVDVTIDSGERFVGRVSRIADEAEFTPRNAQTPEARSQLVYAVEIELQNREGILKIGMPADAEFREGP